MPGPAAHVAVAHPAPHTYPRHIQGTGTSLVEPGRKRQQYLSHAEISQHAHRHSPAANTPFVKSGPVPDSNRPFTAQDQPGRAAPTVQHSGRGPELRGATSGLVQSTGPDRTPHRAWYSSSGPRADWVGAGERP